mmetsp:Transcript_35121/g.52205  ORF Transcript_35121/g.52205 Transcript_35121/m.52205 type:complete len:89 (+) Transcript_35121:38-304(+)
MSSTDPRKVVGSRVMAKAMHVTSEAECARRYGLRKKNKWLGGIVLDVITQPTASAQANTYISARYYLDPLASRVTRLNIRSVKPYPEP